MQTGKAADSLRDGSNTGSRTRLGSIPNTTQLYYLKITDRICYLFLFNSKKEDKMKQSFKKPILKKFFEALYIDGTLDMITNMLDTEEGYEQIRKELQILTSIESEDETEKSDTESVNNNEN